MAEGAGDQPLQKKIKLDDTTENKVFKTFKKNESKFEDLKFALGALQDGYNNMNFILTKFVDLNARSSVSFSRASCVTQPYEKYVAASIFQKGIDVLEQFVNTEDRIKVPANERQRSALCKLLCFLTEDHDEFKELEKVEKKTEGEWAYTILQHLLIKLAVDSKFVIASYPGLSVPPDVSIGYMGDTSFGCEKGWHGSVDILLENLPVQVFKSAMQDDPSESSVSSIEVKSSTHFSDIDESQLIAQTIVFSFLQHKYNKAELENFLVPAIGISTSHIYVNLYDCENDVFLTSEKKLQFLAGGELFPEKVVLLWLALNYRDFCTGITEEMKSFKAGFHRRVDEDMLCEYQDNVKRPFHLSTKKRDNSALEAGRGKKVKRSFPKNEYFEF